MRIVLTLEHVSIDLEQRVVLRLGEVVASVSAKEVALLQVLAAAVGVPVSRDALADAADMPSVRSVDHAVRRLRSKIEANPRHPVTLLTDHGEGYSLRFRRVGLPEAPQTSPRKRCRMTFCEVDLLARIAVTPLGRRRLSSKEVGLLANLAARPNLPVERSVLLAEVWGYRSGRSNAVATTMRRLRLKVERNPDQPVDLLTQGSTYVFSPPSSDAHAVHQGWVVRVQVPEDADWAIEPLETQVARDQLAQTLRRDGWEIIVDDPDGFTCFGDDVAVRALLQREHGAHSVVVSYGEVHHLPSSGRLGGRAAERVRHAGRVLPWGAVAVEDVRAGAAGIDSDLPTLTLRTPAGVLRVLLKRAGEPSILGRSAEMRVLRAKLSQHPIVQLTGAPGSGKTALAAHAGAVFGRCTVLDTRGTLPVLIRSLEQVLRITSGSGHERRAAAVGRSLLQAGRRLFVLEGLDCRDPTVLPMLFRWARDAPEVQWLVVGGAASPGLPVVALEPLDQDDGARLLMERARLSPVLAPEEERAVMAIVARTGGLPLAIILAAGAVWRRGLDEVSAGLGRFVNPCLDDSIGLVWTLLSPSARRSIARLSVFAGPIGDPWIESYDPAVRADLTELGSFSLVTRRGDAWVLLPPVRSFARGGLEDEATWLERHAGAVVDLTNEPLARIGGARGGWALGQLGELSQELDAVIERARQGQVSLDWEARALEARFPTVEWSGTAFWAARHEEAAERAATPEREHLRTRAALLWERGGLPARGLELLLAAGRPTVFLSLVEHLNQAGILQAETGDLASANTTLIEALELVRTVESPELQASVLTNLGRVSNARSDRGTALEQFAEAIYLARRCGHVVLESTALLRRGICHLDLQEVTAARSDLEAALAGHTALGCAQLQALCLVNLAQCSQADDDLKTASELFRRAIGLCRACGNLRLEALASVDLARVLHHDGELGAASELLTDSLGALQLAEGPGLLAYANAVYAMVRLQLGDLDGAEEAVGAARSCETSQAVVSELVACASAFVHVARGRLVEASAWRGRIAGAGQAFPVLVRGLDAVLDECRRSDDAGIVGRETIERCSAAVRSVEGGDRVDLEIALQVMPRVLDEASSHRGRPATTRDHGR